MKMAALRQPHLQKNSDKDRYPNGYTRLCPKK